MIFWKVYRAVLYAAGILGTIFFGMMVYYIMNPNG